MEIYDFLVVKNAKENIPLKSNIDGIKRLAEIHGASNILNLDSSPFIFPVETLPIEVNIPEVETFSTLEIILSTEEVIQEDDKPKRKK